MMIRIIIADDHYLLRQGLRSYFETEDGISIVGEAANGLEVGPLVEQLLPDILFLDLKMPGKNGFEVIQEVTTQWPNTHVIVLSAHSDDTFVRKALAAGADAYIVKDAPPTELNRAIAEVMVGHRYLSPSLSQRAIDAFLETAPVPANYQQNLLTRREREILVLAASGLNNTQIGDKLGISPRTVETHRTRVLHKLGLHNQSELIRYALRNGILNADD
jgi:two-component system response regulator NreC